MAMQPCKICSSNNWDYKFIEKNKKFPMGRVKAICKKCNNFVIFNAYKRGKKNKKIIKEGQLCKKCGHKLIIKESRFYKEKLKKKHYFTHYYYCNHCKTMYHSEEFKVYNNKKENKKTRRTFAEYKIINGKRYLRNNDWNKFKEVGLKRGYDGNKEYMQVVPIKEANFNPENNMKPKSEEEVKEEQYELLMSCLPEDAENLSTLTPNQAKKLIDCFIKKNPWN